MKTKTVWILGIAMFVVTLCLYIISERFLIPWLILVAVGMLLIVLIVCLAAIEHSYRKEKKK